MHKCLECNLEIVMDLKRCPWCGGEIIRDWETELDSHLHEEGLASQARLPNYQPELNKKEFARLKELYIQSGTTLPFEDFKARVIKSEQKTSRNLLITFKAIKWVLLTIVVTCFAVPLILKLLSVLDK